MFIDSYIAITIIKIFTILINKYEAFVVAYRSPAICFNDNVNCTRLSIQPKDLRYQEQRRRSKFMVYMLKRKTKQILPLRMVTHIPCIQPQRFVSVNVLPIIMNIFI